MIYAHGRSVPHDSTVTVKPFSVTSQQMFEVLLPFHFSALTAYYVSVSLEYKLKSICVLHSASIVQLFVLLQVLHEMTSLLWGYRYVFSVSCDVISWLLCLLADL